MLTVASLSSTDPEGYACVQVTCRQELSPNANGQCLQAACHQMSSRLRKKGRAVIKCLAPCAMQKYKNLLRRSQLCAQPVKRVYSPHSWGASGPLQNIQEINNGDVYLCDSYSFFPCNMFFLIQIIEIHSRFPSWSVHFQKFRTSLMNSWKYGARGDMGNFCDTCHKKTRHDSSKEIVL